MLSRGISFFLSNCILELVVAVAIVVIVDVVVVIARVFVGVGVSYGRFESTCLCSEQCLAAFPYSDLSETPSGTGSSKHQC